VLELGLRVVFSLSVVLGLLWLIARVSSRRLRGSTHQGLVRLLVRQPLSRGSSVSVISVGERVLVVGVTEQQVTLLTELDPTEVELDPQAPGSAIAPTTHPTTRPAARLTRRQGGARRRETGPTRGGSVLSAQTWKQALAAATQRTGGTS
jgi:flagellar protein FliO/FliZ